MGKHWRPKNWKNPYKGKICDEGAGLSCELEAFEVGANAMLEALMKSAEKLPKMHDLLLILGVRK